MDKIIVGIDPGYKGGITFMTEYAFMTYPMPVVEVDSGLQVISSNSLKSYLEEAKDYYNITNKLHHTFIYIEKQWGMPNQNCKSVFAQGMSYQSAISSFEDCIIRIIPAKTWKKFYKLDNDKKKSISLAQKLTEYDFIPVGKKVSSDGQAESYLIARYGAIIEGLDVSKQIIM